MSKAGTGIDKMSTDVSYKNEAVQMWLRQCWKDDIPVFQHPTPGRRWSGILSPDGAGMSQMPLEVRKMYKRSYKKGPGRDWVYKTPAELQKERDAARTRMIRAAEAFDEMNRRHGARKIMLEQTNVMRTVGPPWYQELSAEQIEIAENLGELLKSDMEEGHVQRTRGALSKLGLVPRPTEKQVLNAAAYSCTSPVIFLQKLAEALKPKKRVKYAGRVPLYAVRERLVLSALAHLTIPRTLTELHARLPHPPVPPPKRRKEKAPPKRLVYASPFIGRQRILRRFKVRRRKVDRFEEEENERMLKVVTLPMNTRPSVTETKPTASLQFDEWFLRMPNRDRKSTFFRERLAKLRSHQTDADTNELQDEVSFVSNTLRLIGENVRSSFISAPVSAIPEDFMRYATSSDPPDMSHAPSYSTVVAPENSLAPPPLVVPTTIQKGVASFMSVEQELPTAQLEPLVHPPKATMSLQLRLALMGYWDALPRTKYNFPLKNKFTKREPLREMKMVKLLLSQMAKEGNPLAALPQVYLLPHFTKWLLRRNGYKLTERKKTKLMDRSQFLTQRIISRPRTVPLPMDYLPAKTIQNLTWGDIDWFRKKAKKVVDEYYGNMRRAMVDDAREFYAAMCMDYYDNKTFRDVFFAYLPAKEENIFPRNKDPER